MSEPDLPADLAWLDNALQSRPVEVPAGLRPRVLAAVAEELNRRPPGAFWRFAAAAAAAALLGINFSVSVTNNTDCRLRDGITDEAETAARRIHELLPDLPHREARRQALLLAAGARLAPSPAYRPSVDGLRESRRLEEDINP